jgi:hypothetical protein
MALPSLAEAIEERQLENRARDAGRYTFVFPPKFPNSRRPSKCEALLWSPPERKRHLDASIFLKLDEACERLTGIAGYYVPLVIFLAVETGLRLNELCALKWQDVSLSGRRMEVAKPRWPEEHEARTIVLSVRVRWNLECAALALQKDDRYDPLAPIIPMATTAVHRALREIENHAQIQIAELFFDAFHREAETRFDEAGLTKAEKNVMLGSALRILPGSQTDLVSIQHKLDRHLLDGRTYEEAKDSIPLIPASEIISTREMMAEWGVLKIEEASPTVIRHFPNVVLRVLAA